MRSGARVTRGLCGRRRLALGALSLLFVIWAPAEATAVAPQIPAAWVTSVTPTSAVLRAEVNPGGQATSYRFEYIGASAFQANLESGHEGFLGAGKVPAKDVAIGAGSVVLAVSQTLSAPLNPLTPATAYRYRPVATNPSGTTPGPTHTFTTEEGSNAFALSDSRAWELVSPVDKGGGSVAAPESLFGGGAIQAAAAGGAIAYGSASSFGAAQGAPPASQYLGRRSAGGWGTENVSAPLRSGSYGDRPDGVPYRLFSPDLGTGLLFGGQPCRGVPGCPSPAPPLPGSAGAGSYATYYLREGDGGAYRSLLDPAAVEHSAVSPEHFTVSLAAASADLSTVVLSSCAALTADATEIAAGPGECVDGERNLYRWSGGGLELINLLPAAASGTPGARIAAPIGALSTDGSRVYFTQSEDADLYLREAGGPTKWVEESLPGRATFQVASADGSIAFLLGAGGHLYRYVAATNTATDITPAGEVSGVLGISAAGNRVYFQDAAGLELWSEGATTLIAAGPSASSPSDHPPATATARVSADGRQLAFLSAAELGGHDNLDAETGTPDTELYLYDEPTGALICASCNPTGERPRGSASIPGAQVNGTTTAYRPRALSADGHRLIFDSADRLVVPDTNSRPDVYQWEAEGEGSCGHAPGCVSLISSGRSIGGARFLDASEDGSDVFFLTDESLVPRDPGSIDVYDARAGGGLPEPQPPIACVGDACQALPNPPEDPGAGTLVPNSGNPALRIVKEKRKHPHHHKRKRHHRNHRKPR